MGASAWWKLRAFLTGVRTDTRYGCEGPGGGARLALRPVPGGRAAALRRLGPAAAAASRGSGRREWRDACLCPSRARHLRAAAGRAPCDASLPGGDVEDRVGPALARVLGRWGRK